MTLIPAVLVLIVGSELIRNSVDRWFNAPMDEVLSSANGIAGDYYQERQRLVVDAGAAARARAGRRRSLRRPDVGARDVVAPDVTQERVALVEVYRVEPSSGGPPRACRSSRCAAPAIPARLSRESAADRLAAARRGRAAPTRASVEQLANGGELIRAAMPIRSSAPTAPVAAS